MERGTVKFWNEERGFGFIRREGDSDIFAHFSGISDTEDTLILTPGMEITFDVAEGRNGKPKAVNIEIVTK